MPLHAQDARIGQAGDVLPADEDMLARAGTVGTRTDPSGQLFREARITAAGRSISVVAAQSLSPGQRPAAIAFDRLSRAYSPAVVILAGIAGAIRRLLLLDKRRDVRVRRGRIAALLGLRNDEDVLAAVGRRHRVDRWRITRHCRRNPLH